jgi:hypothetical protein
LEFIIKCQQKLAEYFGWWILRYLPGDEEETSEHERKIFIDMTSTLQTQGSMFWQTFMLVVFYWTGLEA